MSRLLAVAPLIAGVCVAVGVPPASAQLLPQPYSPVAVTDRRGDLTAGAIKGSVMDDRGDAVEGAVVSVLGPTSSFAISAADGGFTIRELPPGSYFVRAHIEGYIPVRATLVQVRGTSTADARLRLTRRGGVPQVLAAGIGADEALVTVKDKPWSGADDHGELAWRLRHLKRSALKDETAGVATEPDDAGSLIADSFQTLGRAVGSSARLASSLFTELPFSGQLDLLTSTSFGNPEALLSAHDGPPLGIAYLALAAPTARGDWSMHGAITQGDLSSWLLAGSFVARTTSPHQYDAGLSYTMQRYAGGNAAALAAVADGRRNAGTVYAYDDWRIAPAVSLHYGATYSRFDYLDRGGLLSPRVGVTVTPAPGLRIRASASRREIAPGAEEFQPPAGSGVWLPPERTFSPLSARGEFQPERVDHLEVAAEQDLGAGVVLGLRAFRQDIGDQIVTLFGIGSPLGLTDVGHYFVASAGDLQARGWSVSLSRTVNERLSASIDYSRARAVWGQRSADLRALSALAPSAVRDVDLVHDLTTSVDAELPLTDTRVVMVYSLKGTRGGPAGGQRLAGSRFDVQFLQDLPFLDFMNADWAMLLALRNSFREAAMSDASIYDELLVVSPPKRIVGGLTVRF